MPGYGYRGRYGSGDYDEEPRGGFLKAVVSRAWFLIIPLIGLVWTNAREITPQVKDLKQKLAEEERAIQLERTQTLSKANPLRSHISALAALGDTFEVRFARIDSLMETINTFLDADRKATAKLQAEMDSLKQVHALASAEASAYAESLRVLGPVVDSLRVLIAARNEESQRLWDDAAKTLDLADRALHPEKYRKNTALVTGEGEFPNRDALPKR
jgi:chromosome segregation ATPase